MPNFYFAFFGPLMNSIRIDIFCWIAAHNPKASLLKCHWSAHSPLFYVKRISSSLPLPALNFIWHFIAQSLSSKPPPILLHCVSSSFLWEQLHSPCKSFHFSLTLSLVLPLPSRFSSTGLGTDPHRLLWLLSIPITDICLWILSHSQSKSYLMALWIPKSF